jgi:hypothetical protein
MEVVDTVCATFETEKTGLSATHRRGDDARMAAVYLARECAGLPVTQLAHDLGDVSAPAISKLLRQAALRRHEDGKWERVVGKLDHSLRSAVPKSKVKTWPHRSPGPQLTIGSPKVQSQDLTPSVLRPDPIGP